MKKKNLKFSNHSGNQLDDDNIRYKINTQYIHKNKSKKSNLNQDVNEDNIRYKLPTSKVTSNKKTVTKLKSKPKLKVKFWRDKTLPIKRQKYMSSNKRNLLTRRKPDVIEKVAIKKKTPVVRVQKLKSSPLANISRPDISENHFPMVTVPDDLTIQLNNENANALVTDLNLGFVHADLGDKRLSEKSKKVQNSTAQTSPVFFVDNYGTGVEPRTQGNDNETEYFSKYIVQKLRKMETTQRIYSENLINTVLLLGQLGELNGKLKIAKV
ncbi:unnamed protein product [Leptidea sinapis]|uniref:Uncharacterized protein n=1 Tax=Leptidea sinapis TaxID=189913 RepID=A0A5E4QK70_9NEOP|nr:unnamed protein product [Leptidea sinapis]